MTMPIRGCIGQRNKANQRTIPVYTAPLDFRCVCPCRQRADMRWRTTHHKQCIIQQQLSNRAHVMQPSRETAVAETRAAWKALGPEQPPSSADEERGAAPGLVWGVVWVTAQAWAPAACGRSRVGAGKGGATQRVPLVVVGGARPRTAAAMSGTAAGSMAMATAAAAPKVEALMMVVGLRAATAPEAELTVSAVGCAAKAREEASSEEADWVKKARAGAGLEAAG